MKLIINKSYNLGEIIEIVKNKSDRDFDNNGNEKYIPENMYDIYIAENSDINESTVTYVGDTVQIDDNDDEIYPKEVVENNLEFYYSCQNFQDVIDLAYSQKIEATNEEIIKCLHHYSENDTFLDLK